MDKQHFQVLLEKLLNKELELLRKRFRPYKRRPFLNNKVKIEISPKEENVAGYYENTKNSERQMQYTHHVYITENTMNSYEDSIKWNMKKFGLFNLRQVIKHELIHAFVFEDWEEWQDIKNMQGDYSPIFLSCLYWGGGSSLHPYTIRFLNTDLGEKIQKCRTYNELQTLLIVYILEIERSVSAIKKDIGPYRDLQITFNSRGAGMVKKIYIKNNLSMLKEGKKEHQVIESMLLGIGFLVTPKDLIDNCRRKFENGAIAILHQEKNAYVANDNTKREVIVLSNIKN